MENEKMMAVLTELLEDQKEMVRYQTENFAALEQLKIKVDKIENAMENQKPVGAIADLKPVQQAIEKGFADIKFFSEIAKQKSSANNMRVFLESDAKKWAVYLLVSLTFLTYLYWFVIHK